MNRTLGVTLVAATAISIGCAQIPSAGTVAAAGPVSALRFARLVNGDGAVVNDAVVVIAGERIVSVGRGDGAIPAGATLPTFVPTRRFLEWWMCTRT